MLKDLQQKLLKDSFLKNSFWNSAKSPEIKDSSCRWRSIGGINNSPSYLFSIYPTLAKIKSWWSSFLLFLLFLLFLEKKWINKRFLSKENLLSWIKLLSGRQRGVYWLNCILCRWPFLAITVPIIIVNLIIILKVFRLLLIKNISTFNLWNSWHVTDLNQSPSVIDHFLLKQRSIRVIIQSSIGGKHSN